MKFGRLLPLMTALLTLLLPSVLGAPGQVAERAELITPLLPGTQVPEVELNNLNGEAFSVRAEAQKSPLILIFYRGGW